jgi:phosphoribosylformimino-5-aminoimidazole carboxamide ribotide isomerase
MQQAFEIIPAIDLIDGKCVRLTKGDYSKKTVYNDNPLDVAKQFEDAGINRLHLVDLDGAKAGKVQNWKVLEAITGGTKLSIDFGGGIKTAAYVQQVLDSGANWIVIGSLAVKQPQVFADLTRQFGPHKFFLGADVKGSNLAVHGWQEESNIEITSFLKVQIAEGVNYCFCTDIARDGMLQGPAFDLYKRLLSMLPGIELVASGGVSGIDDVEELAAMGMRGVIIGKALYEGRVTLEALTALNKKLQ